MNFGCFSFNDEEYIQRIGLAMGSPLSPVAACLFMEVLEESHFLKIIGNHSIWLRYVEDVLVVVPKVTDLEYKLEVAKGPENQNQIKTHMVWFFNWFLSNLLVL